MCDNMAEPTGDRNDPELRFLSVERNQFNDPTTQAEWTQKRLVWVPHENQVRQRDMYAHGLINRHVLNHIPMPFESSVHREIG